MATTGFKYHVFLSHNSADKPAVKELATRLKREGIEPWLDEWNLIPGQECQRAMEQALADCATCAVFIGPGGLGPWQNEEMRAAIDRRVNERGGQFRVIPVLLPGMERPERGKLPTFLSATTWVEFRRSLDDAKAFRLLVCGIRGEEPGPGLDGAPFPGQCPYRGLEVFDVAHAPFFFGREALTEWLVVALRLTPGGQENRFLAILGASGSGKSSLARAGLVAALKRGALDGSGAWPTVILRPDRNPIESLAVALAGLPGGAALIKDTRDLLNIQAFGDDQKSLHLFARLALREALPSRRLVVLVDQSEEVFTLCEDEADRKALFDNLLYAATVAGGQAIVVLTMRADFYGKCGSYPALAAAMSDHQLLVGPMTEDELRRVIERPALLAGGELEPGLVEMLLRDVAGQPGALPLLQFTLMELWEQREGRRLTVAAYRVIGGLKGALEQRANDVLNHFDDTQRELGRRIFLRLTQPGEGSEDTKRRASFGELVPAGADPEAVEAVVRRLADARLITTEGDPKTAGETSVEVAHEALIRGWGRLREWIDADRAGLRVLRQLTEAAREWETHRRESSFLYGGSRLTVAQEWAKTHRDALNALEAEFLAASRHKWLKLKLALAALTVAVATLLILVAVVSTFAYSQEADARRAVGRNLYHSLVGEARALRLARVEGYRRRTWDLLRRARQLDTPDRDIAVLQREALACLGDFVGLEPVVLRDIPGAIRTIALCPRAEQVAIGLDNGTVLVRHTRTGAVIARLSDHRSPVTALAFGFDSGMLAAGHGDGTIQLCKPDARAEWVCTRMAWGVSVTTLVSTPEGRWLAGSVSPLAATVHDLTSGAGAIVLPVDNDVRASQRGAVTLSPDGRFLAAAVYHNGDCFVQVWEVATRRRIKTFASPRLGDVTAIAFSTDGNLLACACIEGVAVFDTAEFRRQLFVRSDETFSVAFSPDCRMLAYAALQDGTVRLWSMASNREVAVLRSAEPPWHVAFSADGRALAVASDRSVRVWNLAGTGEKLALSGHDGGVEGMSFSPDGALLASPSIDRTVKIWDPATGKLLRTLNGFQGVTRTAAFSPPDGRLLVVGSADGAAPLRIWDTKSWDELPITRDTLDYSDRASAMQVWVVSFSPDGQYLAVGGDGCGLTLWHVHGPAGRGRDSVVSLIHRLDRLDKQSVTGALFSPDGEQLAWVQRDRSVHLISLAERRVLPPPPAVPYWHVRSLAFCLDGRHLAFLNKDTRDIDIWEVATRLRASSLPNAWFEAGRGAVSSGLLTASSDGTWLALSGLTVTVWDTARRDLLFALPEERTAVYCLAWNPDRSRLAVGTSDGGLVIWNLPKIRSLLAEIGLDW